MAERKIRGYSSPLRRETAAANRQRILRAGLEAMLELGYVRTTMAEVAARAGVAVPTLYAVVPGGKSALARAVYDVTLAGDAQPIPQAERPAVRAIIEEPDPARKLQLFAAMATDINERIAPISGILRAAASTDLQAAELVDRAESQRRLGSRGPAEHLAALGLLVPGLTADRAADQIYALTCPELWGYLVTTCTWTPSEYRDWLTVTLVRTLLT